MILAKGKIAKKPYELSYLGQNIYSIEELCYVIYHNIYGINEEFFQISLAKWMKEELGLKELAEKLEAMIVGEHGLKDLVVTTLCGCDYYNEEEIRGIVKVLDEIDHLPSYQKKKIKADNYVRTGHYGKAVMAYRKLLQGPDAISFTPEEYGDILHNEGIAHFYTSSFLEAGEDFREAYIRNNKRESLQHYLWILLMEEKDKTFEEESLSFGLKPSEIEQIRLKYQEVLAVFYVPEETESMMDDYKEQLRRAFAY